MGALANPIQALEQNPCPWFAIRVKSRFEKVTAAALRGKGFEEFSPLYRSKRNWSDRVKEIDLPLFPGYLFCRMNPNNRLPVLSTPGVVSIVGVGKTPQPVEDSEMAQIQAILKSGLPAQPWPFLRVGQKVSITQGSLTGLEGLLVTVKNNYRLVVSVTLLQRSVAVEIDRDYIRPVF